MSRCYERGRNASFKPDQAQRIGTAKPAGADPADARHAIGKASGAEIGLRTACGGKPAATMPVRRAFLRTRRACRQ